MNRCGGSKRVVEVTKEDTIQEKEEIASTGNCSSSTDAQAQDLIGEIPYTYPTSNPTVATKVRLWLQKSEMPSKEPLQKNVVSVKEASFSSDQKTQTKPKGRYAAKGSFTSYGKYYPHPEKYKYIHASRKISKNVRKSPGFEILKEWFAENLSNNRSLYPSQEEQRKLADQSGLTLRQIGNWFYYARQKCKKTSSH